MERHRLLVLVPVNVPLLIALAISVGFQKTYTFAQACRDRMIAYALGILVAVGALFLNLNVAPTEEIILISCKMSAWHAPATMIASIAIMHAFAKSLPEPATAYRETMR